jgi:AmmeMemoRadiSam system protein B
LSTESARIRPPAVAGAFYPADPGSLRRTVEALLDVGAPPRPAFGAVVPHAGYVYSGGVAGKTYSLLDIPQRVVVLCPNHTGLGASAAVDSHDAWRTPLGDVPVDAGLAADFLRRCPRATLDDRAHVAEHSLEVQLPFLQLRRPDVRFLPVCLGAADLDLCREVGQACGELAAGGALLLASSDMNHYESRQVGNRKNRMALDRIEAIDPEGLFATVLSEDISMCGFLPATALLYAARSSGITRAEVVAQADSGDRTGDPSSVVGYAGVVIG